MYQSLLGHGRNKMLGQAQDNVVVGEAWYNSTMVNSGLCFMEMPSLRKYRSTSYTFSKPPTISRLRYKFRRNSHI